MMNVIEKSKLKELDFIKLISVPGLITGLLWLTSPFEVLFTGVCISFLILFLAWLGYQRWVTDNYVGLPAFALICFVYWVYYGIPYFWAERRALWLRIQEFSEESFVLVMVMVLLGVLVFWLGTVSKIGRFTLTRKYWDIRDDNLGWGYVRLVLVVTSFLGLNSSGIYLMGEGGRAILVLLTSVVPMVAFIILFKRILDGKADSIDKFLVTGFIGYRLVNGLSSGLMGEGVTLFIVIAVLYVNHYKRVPWVIAGVLFVFILFFQVGKTEYRQRYWAEEEQGGRVERMTYWMQSSLEKWQEAFANPKGESIRGLMYESLSRASLIDQTANVLDMTPAVVPYQNWNLYSYLFITFIPRFIWPDKPSVNDSNRFYMATYCLLSEERMERVSVAAGFLAEGYISFGWIGVISIMFLVGIFFNLYESLSLQESLGHLPYAIGVSLLPYLLNIEAQMAQYIGGIVQHVVLAVLIFLPIIRFKKSVERGFAAQSNKLTPESYKI